MKKILFVLTLLLTTKLLSQTFEEFYSTYPDKDIHRSKNAYENLIANNATNYYFLFSNKTYVISTDLIYTSDYISKLFVSNITEQKEINVNFITKPQWVLNAEVLYKKNLTDIGYEGAWTNLNITFEDIGLDLLLKIDQTNDLQLSEFSMKKKSILESLYLNLNNYAKDYNITDMRLYPYNTSNIVETTNIKTYILFNNENYYLKE